MPYEAESQRGACHLLGYVLPEDYGLLFVNVATRFKHPDYSGSPNLALHRYDTIALTEFFCFMLMYKALTEMQT